MRREQRPSGRFSGVSVITAATVAAVAYLLGRLSVWATAQPLLEVQRQLIGGAPPVGGWTFDRLIVDGAALALLGVVAVLVLLVGLNAAGACLQSVVPSLDALAKHVTPSWLRRLTLALCGVALTASAMPTAAQALDPAASPRRPAHASRVSGLPLPDLPSSAAKTVVTVAAGDTLWSIARRALPVDAPESAVATRAAQLYAENRRVIGDNPNLIFPGQQLIAPGGVA